MEFLHFDTLRAAPIGPILRLLFYQQRWFRRCHQGKLMEVVSHLRRSQVRRSISSECNKMFRLFNVLLIWHWFYNVDRVDAIFDSFPYGFKKLFLNASTKSYVLVGNGPLSHYQSADIDGFDVVIRVNSWRSVIRVNSWRSYHTCAGRK